MTVSEKEEEHKWCPFVGLQKTERSHCIGAGCMAWRTMSVNKGTTYHPDHKPLGFCGLVGKPE